MMFSIIVAYGIFILTSIIFVTLILDFVIPKSKEEKTLEKLEEYTMGRKSKIDPLRIFILFLFWFGSGVFLFG